jgi:hypothetical protein
MGIGKMANISDMSENALSGATQDFLRPETLKIANDYISDATAKLPIFRHYDINDTLHSSSDGQQYQTLIHTPRSRNSPKYFGMGKGIAPCTLIINHVPTNAKMLGSHDHESHCAFDLLYNNTSIRTCIHRLDKIVYIVWMRRYCYALSERCNG